MRGRFIILYGTTPSMAQLLKLYIYQIIDNIRILTFYHDNQVSPLNPLITVVCRKVHFCKKTRGKCAWYRITENEPNWLSYTHIISFMMFYKKYAVTGLFLKQNPCLCHGYLLSIKHHLAAFSCHHPHGQASHPVIQTHRASAGFITFAWAFPFGWLMLSFIQITLLNVMSWKDPLNLPVILSLCSTYHCLTFFLDFLPLAYF